MTWTGNFGSGGEGADKKLSVHRCFNFILVPLIPLHIPTSLICYIMLAMARAEMRRQDAYADASSPFPIVSTVLLDGRIRTCRELWNQWLP